MCGRFTANVKKKDLEQEWNLSVPDEYRPRYNISPGQLVASVASNSIHQLDLTKWGYASSSFPKLLVNIRSEGLFSNPLFRATALSSRCIILASGYFEWQAGSKQAFHIFLPKQPSFAMAGLSFKSISKKGVEETQLAIITTQASNKIAHIHERMPVILARDNAFSWLKGITQDEIASFLKSTDDASLSFYPVSGRVNSIANDDPSVLVEFNESLF